MGRRRTDDDMDGTRPIGELLRRFNPEPTPPASETKVATPPKPGIKPPHPPRLKEQVAVAATPLEQMSLVYVFDDGMRVVIPATSHPEFRRLETVGGGYYAVFGSTIALDPDQHPPAEGEDPKRVWARERNEAAARTTFIRMAHENARAAAERTLSSLKGVEGNSYAVKDADALVDAEECGRSFIAECLSRGGEYPSASDLARHIHATLALEHGMSPYKLGYIRKTLAPRLLSGIKP